MRNATNRLPLFRHDTIRLSLLRYATVQMFQMRHDTVQMFQMRHATCECSETSVRKYGLPCAHNIAHAEKAGMTAESIVHWKDTTVAWKRQYAGLEFPVLSMFNIDSSDLIDPMVQYPPVVAAKPGRPNRTRRIINKTTKQKLGPPAVTVMSDFKHNHGSGDPAEPSACLFHNPHAKESASTSLDHLVEMATPWLTCARRKACGRN
jgi:hypothetical protein